MSTTENRIKTAGYAAMKAKAPLQPHVFETSKALGAKDVHIAIRFCGICHSDVHSVDEDWMENAFPLVPGHEVVGVVENVGNEVTKFKKGDRVGVGCLVSSCQNCEQCHSKNEQYCSKMVLTYASKYPDGSVTYGGYARDMVVSQDFVLRIPDTLDLAEAAPLLCAGITTYSPLINCNANVPGRRIGVVGLGGLGHMAVKFGKAFGNHVTVFSHSSKKRDIAMELGASKFVDTSDLAACAEAAGSIDVLVDTVSAAKDMNLFLSFLAPKGVVATVGAPDRNTYLSVKPFSLLMGGKSIRGSIIGGIQETQEMLDFCGKHKIGAMIEKIPANKINDAFARVKNSDVRFRFVIKCEESIEK